MPRTSSARKRRWWIPVLAIVAVVGLIIAGVFFGPSLFSSFNGDSNAKGALSKVSNEIDADLAQCHADAIVAYMDEEGFSDGDYVIGEENIDAAAPGLLETGSAAFGDKPVATRTDLQEVFESEDPDLQRATQAQLNKFPEFDRSVVLNADNWEIVQMTIPVYIDGNTGIVGGNVVSMGTRDSDAGEAGWIFVNPDTCLVQRANFTATGEPVPEGTPESEKPVGFIRPGCTNPGDGFRPPPEEECPEDQPHGTPEACKDGIEAGPNQQGNLPDQQKPNPLPADPDHAQPTEPSPPPTTYTPPPTPPVEPDPDIIPNPPAPPGPPPPVVDDDQEGDDGGGEPGPDW